MSKRIRLSEREFNKIIRESINGNLPLSQSEKVYDYLNELKERMGADALLSELVGKIDPFTLYKALEEIDGMYFGDDGD